LFARLEEAAATGIPGGRATGAEALRRAAVARAAGRHAEAKRRCLAVIDEARAAADGVLFGRAALELGSEIRAATIDPGLVEALREALALLGDRDPDLRCRLEGRLAGALQPAKDPQVPIQMARAAIAAARARGEPGLLGEVLHTAGSALVDLAPLAERLALGTELATLAESQGDSARALAAHARLALDTAEAGELAAFAEHVAEARRLSLDLGHPRRRWRALFLESMLALARGDVETSERCVVEVQQLADLTDDPGLARTLPAHVFYRDILLHRDERVRESVPGIAGALDGVPFGEAILTAVVMGAAARFEDVAGTRAPWARASRVPPFGELRLILAEAAALVATDEERRAQRDGLVPLAHAHVASGHVPVTYEGPVLRAIALLDASLGEHAAAAGKLASLLPPLRAAGFRAWVAQISYDLGRILADDGRVPEATAALREAVDLAAAIGMPGLLVRARARLERLDATAPPPAPASTPPCGPDDPRGEAARAQTNSPVEAPLLLAREGDVWRIEHQGRSVRVRHSRGVELLARLVERPGEEVHVLTLSSDGGGVLVEGDTGEALDTHALAAYRDRLAEIDAELDASQATGDLGRTARLRHEREAIDAELARSVGLHGRSRPNASASERARVNVQRRLKEAMGRIAVTDPDLGAHLQAAIHTGTFCCYRP
jgi:tetratricopeptide (TPR) repeat protein